MKKAGITSLGLATFGSATAPVSAESAGVADQVHELMSEGKTEKAIQLLEENNVKYDYTTGRAPSTERDDSEISTQDVFKNQDDTFTFLGYHLGGNLYNVELWWDHTPDPFAHECVLPNDVPAFTFDGTRWEYEEGTVTRSEQCVAFRSENDGCKAEWKDAAYNTYGDVTGHMYLVLEKNEAYADDVHNVWGHYVHTWTPAWKGSCLGGLLGEDVSLTAGAVSISTAADSWEWRDIIEI